jgi:hypothetical protein
VSQVKRKQVIIHFFAPFCATVCLEKQMSCFPVEVQFFSLVLSNFDSSERVAYFFYNHVIHLDILGCF